MNSVKIICCDIDGTLVRDDKSLSEENKYWIKRAVDEKGVRFVIVSGRIPSALKKYNELLEINGLTSCINGTYLIDESGNAIVSHTFTKDVSDVIISVKEKYNAEMLCAAGNTWFTEKHDGYLYGKKLPIYAQESILGNPRDVIKEYGINKFLFMDKSREKLVAIEDEIKSRLTSCSDASFYPGSDFLEIMPGGVNKGTSVDDLINYYHIDRSSLMALGDDINDIEMIQKAGIGVAMGNALDCVKAVADDITDTNENDGVAKAVQKYVFGL